MTISPLHHLFDRLGTVAGRLANTRRKSARRVKLEIERYPEILRADLGWPPVIDETSEPLLPGNGRKTNSRV